MITGLLHIVRNSSVMFKDIPVFAKEMNRQHRGAITVGQKAEQQGQKRDKQAQGHPHQPPY